ncbi:hypothetical protein [Streptomyces qinglanensis]|uniref:hypothetical protein n=1 Tax=Streptomyces qinglanensis TaxID=943816 RepID=UPI003D75F4D3
MSVEDLREDWFDHPEVSEEQCSALQRLPAGVLAAALSEAFRPHEELWLHVLDATRNDATAALLDRPAAGGRRRALARAAELDGLGRPLCEGTTHRATRNCPKQADFQLQEPRERTVGGYACQAHTGQVARLLSGGEAGPEHARLLIPITTVE